VELLSTNPAKIVGLKDRGTLAVGSHADVTILDPNRKWTFYAQNSRSRSKNSPFDGWKMKGQAVSIVVAGALLNMK
jgi:dihydroorotase